MLLHVVGCLQARAIDAAEGQRHHLGDVEWSKDAEEQVQVVDAPVIEGAAACLGAVEKPRRAGVVLDTGAVERAHHQAHEVDLAKHAGAHDLTHRAGRPAEPCVALAAGQDLSGVIGGSGHLLGLR